MAGHEQQPTSHETIDSHTYTPPLRDTVHLGYTEPPSSYFNPELVAKEHEIDFTKLGKLFWESATKYPDPGHTKNVSEDVRRGLGLNATTYVSLYGGEHPKKVIVKDFIAPDAVVLETTANELDMFIQKVHTSQEENKKVLMVNHSEDQDPHRLEKLDQLAAIAQQKNYLLVIEEPYVLNRELQQSALQLTEKYKSVMVTQASGFPGADLGWTAMSKDIGKYFELIEIPYSPRGLQLELASLLFPPYYKEELPDDEQTIAYDFPIHPDLKEREKSTGYVHARVEQETDPEILAVDGLARLDLSRGELTATEKPELFGKLETDEEYAAFGRMIWESSLTQPDSTEITNAKSNLREWLGINEKPYISISGQGSDKILKKLIEEFTPSHTVVLGHGPQFPQIATYAGDRYLSVQPNSFTVKEGVDLIIQELEHAEETDEDDRKLIIINNPGTPAGDTVSDEETMKNGLGEQEVSLARLEKLAEIAEKGNHILVIDEAFIHSLPKAYSAVKLAETYKSVIVTQSASKVLGFPGVGLGWAVMSEELGKEYKKIEDPLPGPQRVFANALFSEKVIDTYLEKLIPEIKRRKSVIYSLFKEIGIDTLPTNPNTTIMAPVGPPGAREKIIERLKIILAEGSAWDTTHVAMTDQINRMTIPMDETYKQVIAVLNLAKGHPIL